ncbi:hypothetical protein PQX77_003282 [Marasmius sp. AFHP31]|nr:hypothetical protein PQX77_003282 [Marasmius sp. AFHP31]
MAVATPAHTPQQPPVPPPTLALPNDHPTPAQVKMGPLAQILKTGAPVNPAAKKQKPGSAGSGNPLTTATPLSNGVFPTPSPVDGVKKKKGPAGVEIRNGRKDGKFLKSSAQVHKAQQQQRQGNQGSGGQGPQALPPSYPPIVAANA